MILTAARATSFIGLMTALSLGCVRDKTAPSTVSADAGPTALGDSGSAMAAQAAPKLRVVRAGLRVLSIRGGDASANVVTVVRHDAPDATKAVVVGERVEAGDKLRVPAGCTVVARSTIEGMELELTGPAHLRTTKDETVFLYEGELKILSAPRGPASVATADVFVAAAPGTSLLAISPSPSPSPAPKGASVSAAAPGKSTTRVTAPATLAVTISAGESWESRAITGSMEFPPPKSAVRPHPDVDGVIRCRRLADVARAAWATASSPGGENEGGAPEARAEHARARNAARTACAVARLVLERRESPAKLVADLDAAEALWTELPAPTAAPPTSSR